MSTVVREARGRGGKHTPAEPRSWQEVNQCLACLGEMERQIRGLQDQFEQKVAVLKQQLLEASQPLVREKDRVEGQIECFYWAHRDEVLSQGRKSIDLAFGRLGSRSSRGVVIDDAAAALQWLAGNGFGSYVRVRTEIDREALRSALLHPAQPGRAGGNGSGSNESAGLLHCPGIRIREQEEFWYEVDRAGWDAAPLAERRAASGDDKKVALPETQ
jgi:phage host-nuclease inhibitor protein Gam